MVSQKERDGLATHKFKIQMYDFVCESLDVPEPCEVFLKIYFDNNFKIFQTDPESGSANPEWAFKAGFQYCVHKLETLSNRDLKVQCFNRSSNHILGEASLDIQSIACGPAFLKLTFHDPLTQQSRGILRFTCVMKMISENLTVICKDLKLTMQGFPAAARLVMSSSIAETGNACTTNVPFTNGGEWPGPFAISFQTTLGDLLKAPECESVSFRAIDEMGVHQGKAEVSFRKAFTTQPDAPVPFKVPVIYTSRVEGEDEPEPVGSVGELSGMLQYRNLPVYAQTAGGVNIDGQVDGGYWLIEGLPYPTCLSRPPPIWEDPVDRTGMECFSTDPQPQEEQEDNRLDQELDEDTFFKEALEQIDLPAPWEKRYDWSRDRFFFVDPRSRKTTWRDPRFLPKNWDQRIDPQSGRAYFQYHKTRHTTYVDPRCCPQGWEMRLSKNGDIYFAFWPTMQTTFIDPRGLPEAYDAALDEHGRMYFKDHETRATSWEDPRKGQREVTLTTWRQAQSTRWWREQVRVEYGENAKQRLELDEQDDEVADLLP
mmetsp:Transcript_104841/g.208376  ORF Transcript_104841/g.208376 Transcript_104841/m.208376 type:complete len:541 (+) Transcript_104841:84-1706(+)